MMICNLNRIIQYLMDRFAFCHYFSMIKSLTTKRYVLKFLLGEKMDEINKYL